MKILTINCGSSTIKFRVVDAPSPEDTGRTLAQGTIERIGPSAVCSFSAYNGAARTGGCQAASHGLAAGEILAWLNASGIFADGGLTAVGHRVVHGGRRFDRPTFIDQPVLEALSEAVELSPLHNGPALEAILTARETLGEELPMVAVFDTTFHTTMPEWAARYAIPGELTRKHHIRRYGFHGLAHRYMAERCSALMQRPLADMKLITLQLGSGCSACAIAGGKSIDTSMGLTPLEGLMMGTRSGDTDPLLAAFIARHEEVTVAEVEHWLGHRSGLLGVSGYSHDMRDVLKGEQAGNPDATLAVQMFCYRARKYIGAYLAALGGVDGIVFGGVIGEHSPAIREGICATMEWCGIVLDPEANAATVGTEGPIHSPHSRVPVYVVTVDEESVIVRDTLRCLEGRARGYE
ncbi:MAG: acetate kinase [Dehalococcoidia bacterium]|nr:acetate kinase [Dehalococcoidia bacterium]